MKVGSPQHRYQAGNKQYRVKDNTFRLLYNRMYKNGLLDQKINALYEIIGGK